MKEYEAVGVLTKTVYATGDYVAVRRSLIEKFPSCEYTEHCKACLLYTSPSPRD